MYFLKTCRCESEPHGWVNIKCNTNNVGEEVDSIINDVNINDSTQISDICSHNPLNFKNTFITVAQLVEHLGKKSSESSRNSTA